MKNFRIVTYLINIVFVGACLYPRVEVPIQTQLRIDYIVHFAAYFFLTSLALKGFKSWKYVTVFFIAQGVLIEFIQPLTGRSFELEDMAFNTLGVITGFFINRKFLNR